MVGEIPPRTRRRIGHCVTSTQTQISQLLAGCSCDFITTTWWIYLEHFSRISSTSHSLLVSQWTICRRFFSCSGVSWFPHQWVAGCADTWGMFQIDSPYRGDKLARTSCCQLRYLGSSLDHGNNQCFFWTLKLLYMVCKKIKGSSFNILTTDTLILAIEHVT